jgi:hypothetical protein
MTSELAEILKQIVAMLYREAGQQWCSEMIDRINKEYETNGVGVVNPNTPPPNS